MLFNSYPFLLLFLPLTLLGYFWLGRRSQQHAAGFVALASMFFYGWWDIRYVPLLFLSIVFNFRVGRVIAAAPQRWRKHWLIGAVTANLLLLGYFKYGHFFVSAVNRMTGQHISLGEIILPLGISFFTFTQIAFLVDAYQYKVKEYRFAYYCLFVTYFPHLIAGPVLHHKEMMPQFEDKSNYRPRAEFFALGLTIFTAGLFKKVILADGIAPHAAHAFGSPQALSLLEAWGAALSYTFQLYFDFSGYSDMAIGLSYLFGVRLPLNFNSPYKAANIGDFWRRWHMTLSRFLRDYLYIPLGGNKKGKLRRYINLMITMALGGLWHGAGWTFVAWGLLHGLYLVIHQGWRVLRSVLLPAAVLRSRSYHAGSVALTFVAVVIGWVFFRAPNFDIALNILKGMAGANGVALPDGVANTFPAVKRALGILGVQFYPGGGARFISMYAWIGALATLVFLVPNTQQWGACTPYAKELQTETGNWSWPKWWVWKLSTPWSLLVGIGFVISLLSLTRASEFLYFQF